METPTKTQEVLKQKIKELREGLKESNLDKGTIGYIASRKAINKLNKWKRYGDESIQSLAVMEFQLKRIEFELWNNIKQDMMKLYNKKGGEKSSSKEEVEE